MTTEATMSNHLKGLMQMDLFPQMLRSYLKADGAISNAELYERLSSDEGVDPAVWSSRAPVGKNGMNCSVGKRRARWAQQTMKGLGLLERDDSCRGHWRITPKAKAALTPQQPKMVELAFSTRLGLSLWASCGDVFPRIDEPIHLVLTSPPYCLKTPRAYGNVSQSEYVDFICEAMEPLVRNLAPGGNLVLNISNDIFEHKSPARSIYRERLVIALHDRLGLSKMDELIWFNNSKAPGPLQWASLTRNQLNVAYEPVLWFTNDPLRCISSNNRVLQPHSERHQRLIGKGGESRKASFGDNANRIRPGSFGRETAGKIPKNVIEVGHRCFSQDEVRKRAKALGLPTHGATMPLKLARFLVDFLTRAGDLVVDPFSGWHTTALAAEMAGRRWIACEKMAEYSYCGSMRFENADGFQRDGLMLAN